MITLTLEMPRVHSSLLELVYKISDLKYTSELKFANVNPKR